MGKLRELLNSASDLPVRAFSSIFIVLIIVGGICYGGAVWNAIATVIALLSLREYYKLLTVRHNFTPWTMMLSGLFILFAASIDLSPTIILASVSVVLFISLFLEVMTRQVSGYSYALFRLGLNISGLAYIVLPWSFMIEINSRELGTLFLLTLFFCTWSCDVFAYLTGRKFGRHLLCEKISPKKTVEGFVGGALASLLCGCILAFVFAFPPLPLVLMGLICGIAGQLGDLGESVLKREAGVKDTGALIPGHGGFLDRFDSILVNSAFAFIIFEMIG